MAKPNKKVIDLLYAVLSFLGLKSYHDAIFDGSLKFIRLFETAAAYAMTPDGAYQTAFLNASNLVQARQAAWTFYEANIRRWVESLDSDELDKRLFAEETSPCRDKTLVAMLRCESEKRSGHHQIAV